MCANRSDTGTLASSLHRSILGVLLAIAGIIGLGWVYDSITGESLLFGVVGVAVAGASAYWLLYLFAEGLEER